MTARIMDGNGWMEIKDNPISKVGVFPYRGSMVDPTGEMGLEPDGIYQVYRSADELSSQETIDSFKLLPWVDDHLMLGADFDSAESKGVEGVIGQDVYFEDGYLRANLKLFSDEHAQKLGDGKAELSCGYRCEYELRDGVFGDQQYTVAQTKIRGNHLASVDEGRMGSEVAVLDHSTFTVDAKDFAIMPDEDKKTKTLDEYGRDGVEEGEYGDVLQMIASELSEMKNGSGEDKEDDEKSGEDMDNDADRDLGQDEDEDDDKKGEDEGDPDDKKGEDADEDDDKKSGAMDALDAKVRGLERDLREQKNSGVKKIMREIRKRDALYAKVSPTVGAFDHSDMTTDELAKYACDKMGLEPQKGHELTAINAYFVNRVAAPIFGADSALHLVPQTGGKVDEYFDSEAS